MTTIEWTDETWNPVSGCTKVSAGCKNCYAERVFPRVYARDTVAVEVTEISDLGEGHGVLVADRRPRRFTDIRLHHDRLDAPLHWKKPRRVFVNSMSDLFHEDVPATFICSVMATIRKCPRHTFQILTKRPGRVRNLCASGWTPPDNCWLGVSVEDQETADERIPLLLQTPAAVRFVSAEPLLSSINLSRWLDKPYCPTHDYDGGFCVQDCGDWRRLDWVIVGGESGKKARPCDVAWIRSIKDQCRAASVPVFVKQLGANVRGWCGGIALGDEAESDYAADFCDLYEAHEIASSCNCLGRGCWHITGKGGDMKLWPLDLRVREYPCKP